MHRFDKEGNKMSAETTIHLEHYSTAAKSLVSSAQSLADERKHSTVEPIHLLARVLEQTEVFKVLQKIGVDTTAISNLVSASLEKMSKSNNGLAYLSSQMLNLLARAEKEAPDGVVSLEHLLNAMASEKGPVAQILQQYSINATTFRTHSEALKSAPKSHPFIRDLVAKAHAGEFGPIIGRDAEVRRLLQVLSRQNKNNPLLVGEPGSGKSAIVEEIAKRFDKGETPPNLSKMSFVEMEISTLTSGAKIRGEVEDRINNMLNDFKQDNKRVILLVDGIENLLTQGSMNVSDLFKTLLIRNEVRIFGMTTPDGLRKINEKDPSFGRRFTVLTIEPPTSDQAIEIVRGVCSRFEKYHGVSISNSAILSAVNLAKRYVQDKALPDSAIDLLDEASARKRVEITGMPAELDKDVRRLSSLKVQQAKLLDDPDPSGQKVLSHLVREIAELEPRVLELRSKLDSKKNALSIRDTLTEKYQKATLEIEQAKRQNNFARIGELEHGVIPELKQKLERADKILQDGGMEAVSNIVGEQEVAQVVGDWTGVPVAKLQEDESAKLLKMEERIGKRVVGQEEAVEKLSKAIRRSRVGLRDPKKPIGSFLFLGSSGCGKTELAKALAEFLFDDEQAMTRFDMSEFGEKHLAARLLGSPNGYQNSEAGGELTEAVRKRPYSVLLFDEVEKAHPDIFNILLALLDDGRVSDARGRTTDFSNTVVILTSNIGSKRLLDADTQMFETKEGREDLREGMLADLKGFLRPEFINRVDNVLLFKPLPKEALKGIADIEIRKVEKLLAERELKLVLSEEAKNYLVDSSYQAAFGARPLKRAIIEHIQNHLAEALLHKGYKDGSTIKIDIGNDNTFVFEQVE
jgi:ATP-dependent Clp protease ATP-binding subunit ClpB